MKEEKYHLYLDDNEYRKVIQSLVCLKNSLADLYIIGYEFLERRKSGRFWFAYTINIQGKFILLCRRKNQVNNKGSDRNVAD